MIGWLIPVSMFWLVAALYLGQEAPVSRLLDDVPRRLEIEYFHPFTAEQFRDSTSQGIENNVGAERAGPGVHRRPRKRLAEEIEHDIVERMEAATIEGLVSAPRRGGVIAFRPRVSSVTADCA